MLDEFQVCCTVIALNIYKLLFFFRFFSYLCVFIRFSHVGLYDPMDRSPPGSSVHGIFKARVLEWVAIAFSESSYHRKKKKKDLSVMSDSLQSHEL